MASAENEFLGQNPRRALVCDLSVERADAKAKHIIYATYEEVCEDDSVDIVHIATPHIFHKRDLPGRDKV